MNDFLTSIFLKIAQKMGFELQQKRYDTSDFFDVNNISITATLSDRLSTIALMDSSISINGNNKRAEFLNEFVTNFWNNRIKASCVTSLGTGDCLLKPNIIDNKISVDIISNDNFIITDSIGDYILGVLVKCEKLIRNNDIYERVEYHRLKNENGTSNCHIYQMAFKNGQEIALESVPAWENLPKEQIITNVNNLLFGRLKCPILNRENINSANGVPITYGLDSIVKQAKDSYNRYNKEFQDKETKIFADKSIFSKDSRTGKTYVPSGMKNLFMKIRGAVDKTSIETYSPDIRDNSLDNSIERNFRMLELFIGIGEGVVSKSNLTYTNVDEVKASRSATFSFITNFRNSIMQCVKDLVNSISILCNVNSVTPYGEYDISFDWSDQYMESSQERFNQLMQSLDKNIVDKAEVRSWVMSENLDDSQKWIQEKSKSEISVSE